MGVKEGSEGRETDLKTPRQPCLLAGGFKSAILPDEVMYPDCIIMGPASLQSGKKQKKRENVALV